MAKKTSKTKTVNKRSSRVARGKEWDRVKQAADKRRAAKPAKEEPKAKAPAVRHRVNTHGPSGSTSREVLPEPSPVNLGPIILPPADKALGVLQGLAELNDRATQAHKTYEDLKERTKTAKEKWEGLAEEVQTKLRLATHGSDLPLFDPIEREEDLKRMAGSAGQDAPEQATEGEQPEQAGEVFGASSEPAAAQAGPGLDDLDRQIPF